MGTLGTQKKKINKDLFKAAETGNTGSLQDALSRQQNTGEQVDINCHNKEDWTTLHVAVNEGHYNIA